MAWVDTTLPAYVSGHIKGATVSFRVDNREDCRGFAPDLG